MTPLSDWSGFYSALGSAAGSLTGLQFVMMALIGDLPARPGEEETSNAFATPTIVHFAAVLLLVATGAAPWATLNDAAVAWSTIGTGGLVYLSDVARRMRRQVAYKPVFEDHLFHVVLPSLAYLSLGVTVAFCRSHPRATLFVVGLAAVVLLMVGIHNAWDNATYVVNLRRRRQRDPKAS